MSFRKELEKPRVHRRIHETLLPNAEEDATFLEFDPEKEFSIGWKEIRQILERRRLGDNWNGRTIQYFAQGKILFPEEFEQEYGAFVRDKKQLESVRRLLDIYLNGVQYSDEADDDAFSMDDEGPNMIEFVYLSMSARLLDPEGYSNFVSPSVRIKVLDFFSDWGDGGLSVNDIILLCTVKFLFPDDVSTVDTNISISNIKMLKKLDLSNDLSVKEYISCAASLRLVDQHEFQKLHIDRQALEKMKQYITRRYPFPDWWYDAPDIGDAMFDFQADEEVLFRLADLKIICAESIDVTDRGLEINMHKKSSHQEKIPPRPIRSTVGNQK